ncbi:MAG: ABC transporter ATP-binding protein [Oscillospiraceae bacterium]|nr:ABC transporter ATP-binding protein [Oscillospiraceae bacterium]
MEHAIEVKNLVKNYDGFSLKDVSFNLPCGTVMGFIGQNGAGKTTTIKAILNLFKRNGGDIKIFGLDNIKDEEKIKEDISVVFDEICFHDTLNAYQLNKVFSYIYKNWSEKTYLDFIEKFELPLKKKIKTFSRGMKMKLQIAVALSHEAKLLILDEPTSGLDPVVRIEVLDVFREYMQDESRSILISSHLTADLEKIADYITFIDKGKILLSESKDKILESHRIIKCGKDKVSEIKAEIIGSRITEFGAEVLVKDFANNPGATLALGDSFICEGAALDDIMRFYCKGGETGL